ncbi:MAG: ANTAR domain-containing protein [Gammaproteobacteria bacterium]|jgi:response regulator NasT
MTLRVMLVDKSAGRSAILEQALADQGYEVVARLGENQDLLASVRRHEPDIILIDMELPDRDTLESMRVISREIPRPVVMFADQSDEQTIGDAVSAGVSAYIVDGLSANRLKPIMDVAIARFREFQALRNELEQTRNKLVDRRDIDKAKGILMRQKGMSEDAAYSALRKLAMDRNQKMGDVARMLISASELLG